MKKTVLFFLISLLMATSTIALGIAPATRVIDFGQAKETRITYRVYNSEQASFTAHITANGSLSRYLRIEPKELKFSSHDRFRTFAVVAQKPKTGQLAMASINVRGLGKTISAELRTVPGGLQSPTARAVKEPKAAEKTKQTMADEPSQNNNRSFSLLIYILLGVVIIGNILYLAARRGKNQRRAKPMDSEELKQEIIELKHELDTFDFSGFENTKPGYGQ